MGFTERKAASAAYKRLLDVTYEAAALEQMVILQYLYAAFSVKESFSDVRGWGFSPTKRNLLGVTVQEMQHLHFVNLFRRVLEEPPVVSAALPAHSNWYPFELKLEPLSRESAWKYAYVEAPEAARPALLARAAALGFSIDWSSKATPPRLYELFEKELRAASRDLSEVLTKPIVESWLKRASQIRDEGHHEHFVFFESLFEETHPVFKGNPPASWASKEGPMYPSVDLRQVDDLPSHFAQDVYHLTSLLLHASYLLDSWTAGDPYAEYANVPRRDRQFYWSARDLMMEVLFPMGCALGMNGISFPFGLPLTPPRDRALLMALVRKISKRANALAVEVEQMQQFQGRFKLDALRATLAFGQRDV